MSTDFRVNDENDNGIVGANDSTNKVDLSGPPRPPRGIGVFGFSNVPNAAGVLGANNNGGDGVTGFAHGNGNGVVGVAFDSGGTGVLGRAQTNGVIGKASSDTGAGVNGGNDGKGFGVFGGSKGGPGVQGNSIDGPGVVGFSQNGLAGRFDGNVDVKGDIRLVNSDCAEEFDTSTTAIDPGTVVVLDDDGTVRPCNSSYDKRVAGVVSGAGDYKPALILDRQDSGNKRVPVSFLGKVCCKVDAEYGAIRVGDLLTTSPTPGRAMKVSDRLSAFGAVIGKALRPLERGQGLIPMLVALQ
jgi:hypothetical protein